MNFLDELEFGSPCPVQNKKVNMTRNKTKDEAPYPPDNLLKSCVFVFPLSSHNIINTSHLTSPHRLPSNSYYTLSPFLCSAKMINTMDSHSSFQLQRMTNFALLAVGLLQTMTMKHFQIQWTLMAKSQINIFLKTSLDTKNNFIKKIIFPNQWYLIP